MLHPLFVWSRRGLNPRPNGETISFLHAYLRFVFSDAGKTGATKPTSYPLRFHQRREAAADYSRFCCATMSASFGTRASG